MCILCGKDSEGRYKVSTPMKDSNTSGIKSHLQRHHKREFNLLFPSNKPSLAKKKSVVCRNQSTLEQHFNVRKVKNSESC